MKSIHFNKLFFLMMLSSVNVFAQEHETLKKDGYTLTINNQGGKLADQQKEVLSKAFFKVYPAFARADGYHTKREVQLEISKAADGLSASEGNIAVNPKWLKKNTKQFEQVLQQRLSAHWVSADTITKNGYSLVFISKDPNLDLQVKQKLIDTYFKVYPVLVDSYNPASTKDVLFVVDTAYKAVAEASNGRILFSANYLKHNPTDIDVVTHETMHIAQGYSGNAGPGWLTEGIADYIRYKHGVDNVGSKWSLPAFAPNHHYTNAYRITARFFAWMEKSVKPGIVKTLDAQLRSQTYSSESWKTLTGKTLDELWVAYTENPAI